MISVISKGQQQYNQNQQETDQIHKQSDKNDR